MSKTPVKTVFTTERAKVHQQALIAVAPDILDIHILQNPDAATLKQVLGDAVYLISERRGIINAELLNHAPKLKLILRLGSQSHDIDLEVAQERGIIVCYWSQASVIRVAEHVILQILALIKHLNEAQAIALSAENFGRESKRTDENTFAYNWSKREHVDSLSGKTIGILGFGEIGFELARRLQFWGVDLRYNKRNRLPESVESLFNLSYESPESLFKSSDILVNLLPYSAETDGYINAERLTMMKNSAMLVSVGSGAVIDENALAVAIETGSIAGAALDTYEYEPLRPENPLLALAKSGYNLILTPHIAAGTMSNLDERREQFTNIIRHINGEPLLNRLV